MASLLSYLRRSIGRKIILPYLVLTLVIGAVGAYVVTRLVTDSLQERFYNQLLDAGRIVSETTVERERERLAVLRTVSNTQGVGTALAAEDRDALAALVPQIMINSNLEAAALVNREGIAVFGWERGVDIAEDSGYLGRDFSVSPDIQQVLAGQEDEQGIRRVSIMRIGDRPMFFTSGPVYDEGEIVGAALVGTYLDTEVQQLAEVAVARVTLYDREGQVVATTLGSAEALERYIPPSNLPDQGAQERLQTTAERYQTVSLNSGEKVYLQDVELLEQSYLLAYGDWRLRDQSFGLFSVALPSNFIVSTAATSRNLLSILFSLGMVGAFAIGLLTAGQLVSPLRRLALVADAVSAGDLSQRSGIEREDEIGILASAFDLMTGRLAARNRELLEETSRLRAILESIADGVLVFGVNQKLEVANPAAQRFLDDAVRAEGQEPGAAGRRLIAHEILQEVASEQERRGAPRYHAGSRVFSTSLAPVETPDGERLGRTLVLRDVTQEAEAEQLKDNFITSISHELRTPLTAINGYTGLLKMAAASRLTEQDMQFIERIDSNTSRLIDHVSKLIKIAEIHHGSLNMEKHQVWLSTVMQKLAQKWQGPMEDKGLAFCMKIEDNQVWVEGDRERLEWAIDNVLGNAHAYTPCEGTVHVRLCRENGKAQIKVKDSGVGISSSDLPRIFDSFYRAETDETFSTYGLGLGLYITRSLVVAHGGDVQVESELGKGSCFTLIFPAIQKKEAT